MADLTHFKAILSISADCSLTYNHHFYAYTQTTNTHTEIYAHTFTNVSKNTSILIY